MKITKCEGNGQGICNRCGNIVWMTLLCKIENVQGIYCSNCVRKMNLLIKDLVEFDYNITKTQFTPEIDVCTNDINNAFEYIINRVGFIDEVSFTRR